MSKGMKKQDWINTICLMVVYSIIIYFLEAKNMYHTPLTVILFVVTILYGLYMTSWEDIKVHFFTRIQVTENGDFWVDKNDNCWSTELFSLSEVKYLSTTLLNCSHCLNCAYCKHCLLSSYCIDCRHCLECHDCNECYYCENCENCTTCIHCMNEKELQNECRS